MKKEYQIKLLRNNKFDHNVYITCETIKQVHLSIVEADGISIDFILAIGEISVL